MPSPALNTSAELLSPPSSSILETLQHEIGAIERGIAIGEEEQVISLGTAEIDAALPWNGLPINGLHEITGDVAALGFTTMLLARLADTRPEAPILWCQRSYDLYGHGLLPFGLDPNRLIFVHGDNDNDILWAMEEGLRCSGLAAVIGRMRAVPPVAGRRLQLATKTHKTVGFLLRTQKKYAPTNSALTRWHVVSAPSSSLEFPAELPGLGAPQWQVALQRCRLAKPQNWQVKWCDETRDLCVVADVCDRQVVEFRQHEAPRPVYSVIR